MARWSRGDRLAVGVAAAAWVGAGVGRSFPAAVVAASLLGAVVGWRRRHRPTIVWAMALAAGLVSGLAADHRERAVVESHLPVGSIVISATALTDASGTAGPGQVSIRPDHILGPGGWHSWRGPKLLASGLSDGVQVGDRLVVAGDLRSSPGTTVQGPYAGRFAATEVHTVASSANPMIRGANALRRHVIGSLDLVTERPEGALLSGFLIGDIRRLPTEDREALRLAGLSHFVVVSGSNVALFLAAFWIVSGPLAWSPRRRVVVGLVAVVLFAVVTRWEPSVLRASAMAGVVLAGRLMGWHLSAIRALALAVAALVLMSGGIVNDVGFQLSAAATGGIIIAAPLWIDRRPRWLWTPLGATLAAQTAVSPLLLAHFGEVPLMAPVTNLVSAPLVAAATASGGFGAVTRIGPVVEIGTALAAVVLGVARASADMAQIGAFGVLALVIAGLVAALRPGARGPLALGGVVLVGFTLLPSRPPSDPLVVFLDVGQGDATLFRGPSGETILIDGGVSPGVLRRHLRSHGVERIDLVMATHLHSDHAAGLVGITRVAHVGQIWHPDQLGHDSPLDRVVGEAISAGVPVAVPSVGDVVRVGVFTIEVLGPVRRYASPNDGSLVVAVEANGVRVLMSGDIEAIAQADLGPLRSDIMKVPHQGAATSDLEWLSKSRPEIAVISVGPNTFGHPSREIIQALTDSGSIVRRTDLEGSITVVLDRSLLPSTALASSR